MKGIQKYFRSPFLCFHGNCGKVCPTDSDFFGLCQVVLLRVDFFKMAAVAMETAKMLKN
jgi:hypothetical protein